MYEMKFQMMLKWEIKWFDWSLGHVVIEVKIISENVETAFCYFIYNIICLEYFWATTMDIKYWNLENKLNLQLNIFFEGTFWRLERQ